VGDNSETEGIADPGPGVHVVAHPNPRIVARVIAHRLGAEVVDTPALAEAVVAQRARVGEARAARARLDHLEALNARIDPGPDPVADAQLASRLPELREACARHRREPEDLDRLRRSARDLAGLEAVFDGTRLLWHQRLGPTSDDATAAMEVEEAAVAEARRALALLPTLPAGDDLAPGDELPPDHNYGVHADEEGTDEEGTDEEQDEDWPEVVGPDGSSLVALGIMCLGLVGGCVVLLVGWPLPAAAVPVLLSVLLAALVRRTVRVQPDEPDAPHEDTLPVPADLDSGGGGEGEGRQDDGIVERWRRTSDLAAAEAALAEARRDWEALAGPDIGPDRADERVATSVAGSGGMADLVALVPAVRAVESVHGRRQADWRAAWAELGRPAPAPRHEAVDAILDETLAVGDPGIDRAEADDRLAEALAAAERLRARAELAEALGGDDLDTLRAHAPDEHDLDDSPVVLVEPFRDLDRQQKEALRRSLDSLDAALQVVVVVRSPDDVPTGAG